MVWLYRADRRSNWMLRSYVVDGPGWVLVVFRIILDINHHIYYYWISYWLLANTYNTRRAVQTEKEEHACS